MRKVYAVEMTSFVKMPGDEIKKEHRKFLRHQVENGKLKLAGRMLDNTGSFLVWEAGSLEEAKSLASSDPYFREGYTTFFMKGWDIFWNTFVEPPVTPEE